MTGLVLSLFSGAEMFDTGFREEGFCVVSAGDVLFGQDICDFHPPTEVFGGIIGGDPCQSHSSLANLVRAKGLEPSFPDMTPEFERVVEEARPAWFVRENVHKAPDVKPLGYEVTSFLLDNCWLGEAQRRKRRFWFGWDREEPAPNLRRWIPGVALELPETSRAVLNDTGVYWDARRRGMTLTEYKQQAVAADSRAVPDRHGGSGKVKVTADGGHDGHVDQLGAYKKAKTPPVTGRNEGAVGAPGKDYSPPRRTLEDMLELQGFPTDFFGKHSPFTMSAKRKLVGNAVSLPMSRAIARAVVHALERRAA